MAQDAFDQVSGALGFVGDVIGTIGQIGDGLFPPPDAASLNNFRVHVGLVRGDDPQGEGRSTSGDAPALAAWDASGNFLDQDTPDDPNGAKIADGGSRNYGLVGRSDAEYLSIVRTGNDGICISLITGVTASLGRQSMWTGDIGKFCGAPWYNQNNAISDGRPAYTPACMWLDGNADEGHIWKGFNFHLGSFPGTNTDDADVAETQQLIADAWNKDRRLLCGSEPMFSMYEDIEIGHSIRTFNTNPSKEEDIGSPRFTDLVLNQEANWRWGHKPPIASLPKGLDGRTPKIQCLTEDPCPPQGPSWNRTLPQLKDFSRRMMRRKLTDDEVIQQIKKRQVVHADRLIVSKFPQHSAVELCESPYSLGPDMVSWTEGMFCDMSEKQLWPVCADAAATYCFDMDSQTVRGSAGGLETIEKPLYPNDTSATVKAGVAVAVSAGRTTNSNPAVPNKSYITVNTWDP